MGGDGSGQQLQQLQLLAIDMLMSMMYSWNHKGRGPNSPRPWHSARRVGYGRTPSIMVGISTVMPRMAAVSRGCSGVAGASQPNPGHGTSRRSRVKPS